MKCLTASLFLIASCVVAPALAAPADDVREAVFRYQMRQCAPVLPVHRATVYFLGFGYLTTDGARFADPSAVFMRRFAGGRPLVRAVSDAVSTQYARKDRKTGRLGPLLVIWQIKALKSNKAVVKGEIIAGMLLATDYEYTLTNDGKRWRVVGSETLGST